jgi:flagellar hook-associated protein 3 FlgL
MRVASKSIYDAARFNLANIQEQLYKANQVVATGKRITAISDDPVGLTQSLHVQSAISNLEQLGRNISMGKTWLAASESSLSQVQDIISDARALCVQMVNGTIDLSQQASAATIVQNHIDEIVSLGNTEANGQYVFAGWKTDTVPFGQDGTYYGDNNAFTIKIGNDTTIEIGADGEAIFQDLFTTLSDLKDALEGNDVEGIRAAMTSLDIDHDRITTKIPDIGSKVLRVETNERIFQDVTVSNTQRLSEIEDADMAAAIIDLESREVVYKAALASSARIMQLSLVDFLSQ